MLFVTVNLCPHLYCKYPSFTRWTNDSTTCKSVLSSHDEVAAFPTIPSTSRLCGAGGRDPLPAPPGLAAASPLCLAFLPFVSGSSSLSACFFLLVLSCLHPSFLHWPFTCLLLRVCSHPIPAIPTRPLQPFLSSHFHHRLPLPSVHSAILLLSSVSPAAIRANQIPEQLCKAVRGFPLIPWGGEQSWAVAAPQSDEHNNQHGAMGTSLLVVGPHWPWPHEHPWLSHGGSWHKGCPEEPTHPPSLSSRSGSPRFRSLGDAFGGGRSLS